MNACARDHDLHGISVVIPILNDDKRVKLCLASLLNQSLSLDFIEIVLVRNFTSARDSSIPLDKSIQRFLDKFIHVQVLSCELGNSNASNAGVEAAQFKHLTIVDCDDYVSFQYLELLLRGTVPDDFTHVVLSPIINFHGIFNRPEISKISQRTMLERKAGQLKISENSKYSEVMLFANQLTGKLFHTHVFCEEKFDPGLTAGMDTELAVRLIRNRKVTSVSSSARGCYYLRILTFPSISRPTTRDYKFSVTDRIRIINSLVPNFLERDLISVGIITSQKRFIIDYLNVHSEQLARVTKDLADSGFDQNLIDELIGSN